MTEIADYRLLEQTDYFNERLAEVGLVAPAVRLTSTLDRRMHRHGRTMDIDEGELMQGIMELELEEPVTLTLDSYSKYGDATDPTLSIPAIRRPEAIITLNPHPDAERKDAGRRLNAAFWTGVVALDALTAEGGADQYEDAKRRAGRRQRKDTFAALLSGLAVDESLAIFAHAGLWGLAANVAANVGVTAGIGLYRRRYRRMDLGAYVLSQHAERGQDMAKDHPVLTYGFDLS